MIDTLTLKGKRYLTIGVTIATILWSIGIFSIQFAAGAVSGDLIKIQCTGDNQAVCTAVYYLGADGKRYVFPNEKTYKTWYDDFSSVQSISQTEMESYPIGGNVTYRPGVKMVKITTDPKVYVVAKNGTLRWVKSEAVARDLYGDNWNKMIDDVPDPFFVNYTISDDDVDDASEYDKDAEKAGSPTINEDKGLTQGGGGAAQGGSTLTIALSPDTPASGLVFGSSARVPFTTFTLTASSDGDVKVDSITIERVGIAQDGAFSDFDLLDAETELPLNNFSKSLNSSHQAVFGDDIVVKAGMTKKIIVAANMASGALSSYAGETPAIAVVDVKLKGGATLVGNLPITGNYQTVNGTVTAGSAEVSVGSNNPSATTKEVGTTNYIVSSIKITNNSSATNQDFKVKSITWTNNGSSAPDDVENLELINTNSGEVLATIAHPDSDEVSFTGLNLEVKKGNSINLDLRLDIKSGSARKISYDIDQKADIVIFDMLRGVNVLPTYKDKDGSSVTSSPFYNANDTTIGDGKLRIESMAITPDRIAENQRGVLVGKFKFVMEGEPGNITALGLKISTTTTGTLTADDVVSAITNLVIKDPDGNTVAGPQDPKANQANNGFTATTTDTITVPVGETVYSVYADLSDDWTANDTIQIGIFPEAITIKGDVSGNTITPTPSGQVQSTQLTIKAAALAVSQDSVPASQTVVAGTQDFEVSRIVLDASDSGSDVRVTQVKIPIKTTGNAFPDILTGIQLFDGTTEIPVDTRSISCSGATCSTAGSRGTTTLTISAGNLVIPAGQTKVIRVVGDVGTGATSGTFKVGVFSDVITAIDSESQTVTETTTNSDGPTMTLASGGTLNISITTDPKAALVVGGTTVDVGKFIAEAKYEGMNIRAIGFEIKKPDGGIEGDKDEVDSLELWEQGGSSPLGTITVNKSRATITPADGISLAINEEKTYIVKAKFAELNDASPATSGAGVEVKLSYIDVSGTSTGSSSVTVNGIGNDFKTFTVFKSIPTVAIDFFDGSNQITGNSTVTLLKFHISADSAGPIGLGKITFGISSTTAGVKKNSLKLYESNSSGSEGDLLADSGDIKETMIVGGEYIHEARFDVNNDDSTNRDAADKTEHLIISAGSTKYFTLKGTVFAHDGTSDNESISTAIAGDNEFAGTTQLNFGDIDGTVGADDFIWSDLNFDQYASSTATNTVGWFNGYRVPGLVDTTTTAQTITD